MSAGYPITRADLDNRMGGMIVAVRDSLSACVLFKASLDDATLLPDSTLQAAPLSYSAGDCTQIRAAFAAMQSLNNISRALATQGSVNDFWFDGKHLAGLNFR